MLQEEHEVAMEGLPQGFRPMKSTVVNIHGKTVAPDHIVWSMFNILFLNPCLGFVAFAYSVKSRDRKMVGDVIGAQSYASTAKCLNIWAVILGIIMLAASIAIIAIFSTAAVQRLWNN